GAIGRQRERRRDRAGGWRWRAQGDTGGIDRLAGDPGMQDASAPNINTAHYPTSPVRSLGIPATDRMRAVTSHSVYRTANKTGSPLHLPVDAAHVVTPCPGALAKRKRLTGRGCA